MVLSHSARLGILFIPTNEMVSPVVCTGPCRIFVVVVAVAAVVVAVVIEEENGVGLDVVAMATSGPPSKEKGGFDEVLLTSLDVDDVIEVGSGVGVAVVAVVAVDIEVDDDVGRIGEEEGIGFRISDVVGEAVSDDISDDITPSSI